MRTISTSGCWIAPSRWRSRPGRFGWQALRAALDSSPLVGAGRVEDTWNLIGHALRTVATCAAKTLRIPRDQVLRDAGVTLLGASSLKAALDIDWSDPAAQTAALARLLAEVEQLERWVHAHVPTDASPAVATALTTLRRVLTQDLEPDPATGTAAGFGRAWRRDRMPSLGDAGDAPWPEDAHETLHRATNGMSSNSSMPI